MCLFAYYLINCLLHWWFNLCYLIVWNRILLKLFVFIKLQHEVSYCFEFVWIIYHLVMVGEYIIMGSKRLLPIYIKRLEASSLYLMTEAAPLIIDVGSPHYFMSKCFPVITKRTDGKLFCLKVSFVLNYACLKVIIDWILCC